MEIKLWIYSTLSVLKALQMLNTIRIVNPFSKKMVIILHPFLCALYIHLGYFYFGWGVNILCIEVIKHFFGRLRPNFIAVCQPDWNQLDCTDSLNYIEDPHCQQKDSTALMLARK